jgi:beta-1,4-N-acetylglucosaminyltransferase
MLMMMDDGKHEFGSFHRRYLISSGDSMSLHHLEDYEAQLNQESNSPGTYDTRVVTRARRVHQPLWSTPLSALRSILDIFPVLMSPPENAAGNTPRYPEAVFSNGPATGFFVALAVHFLKLVSLVPDDATRFIYIESWARISTLSLTGKLLYYTGLADAFYVQHQEVADRYGLVNAGEMVFNAQRTS